MKILAVCSFILSQSTRVTDGRLCWCFVDGITSLQSTCRDLQWVVDTDSQQRLRSLSSQQLIVPNTRLFTVGDRAFNAAARIWNSLPPTVIYVETLNSF